MHVGSLDLSLRTPGQRPIRAPAGFAFLVDEDGSFIVTTRGEFILVECQA